MPISEEFLEKFKEKHNLGRAEELYCWKTDTITTERAIVSVVCLNIAAPEAAKCGLGRESDE